jgi:hypothetical protein
MFAFGQDAFQDALTPEIMYRTAASVRETHEDISEELIDFAHDLAVIRALPQVERVS